MKERSHNGRWYASVCISRTRLLLKTKSETSKPSFGREAGLLENDTYTLNIFTCTQYKNNESARILFDRRFPESLPRVNT